jgi:aspartyl/glutamyl-tRNA(Asn/Gln) amidotransferase C subunit
MSVDRDHAAAIAALARLRFGDEELSRITGELNRVLDHVETLRSLGVDDVPGGEDPLEGEGDTVRGPEAETPDRLGAGVAEIAPDSEQGFFVVPPLPGVQAGEVE